MITDWLTDCTTTIDLSIKTNYCRYEFGPLHYRDRYQDGVHIGSDRSLAEAGSTPAFPTTLPHDHVGAQHNNS